MPELSELQITKRGVSQCFVGQRLLACVIREPRWRWRLLPDVQYCDARVQREAMNQQSTFYCAGCQH